MKVGRIGVSILEITLSAIYLFSFIRLHQRYKNPDILFPFIYPYWVFYTIWALCIMGIILGILTLRKRIKLRPSLILGVGLLILGTTILMFYTIYHYI